MENLLKNKKINIDDGVQSPFLRAVGVYQDGSIPMYRDTDGKLWAMSGHSHKGHIGMFCFCEAGNLGKESPIVKNAWHSRVAYSTSLKAFVMTSTAMLPNTPFPHVLGDYMHIRTSTDMIKWSEPITVEKNGERFGNHYHTIVSATTHGQPNVINDEFLILTGHNGTDVIAHTVQMK